ncbi:MAG: alpha/beta hydrolase [Hydrococcus sp. Prado102]|jgi:pimeloyl-ACP methyl ester carboxylesterase|nr:alpha/beta hydrolase [Hydrococcus sp. Prado102]
MQTIDILGVSHAYELTPPSPVADNPVLVFVHGWLLSRNYWKPLVERLSPEYQCLIYDLRGFGDTRSPLAIGDRQLDETHSEIGSNYSLAAYAEDLKILLQKLAIAKAWLIGHSLGGSIALWGADCSAEIVKGVICLNAGGGIYLKEEFERFRTMGQQSIQRRPSWLCSLPLIDVLFARMMVARPLKLHWGRQRVIDFLKADEKAAIGSLLDSTTEAEVHFLPQLVARLQQPVYFVAGDKDKIMELKYVRYLASFHELFATNGGNVVEIANCGHLSMLEQPEIVSAKIVNILMKHFSK